MDKVLANADIRSKSAKKQVGDVFLLELFVQHGLILNATKAFECQHMIDKIQREGISYFRIQKGL